MALSAAQLRILDATGKVVVSGRSVPASGLYGPIPLTGSGPYRLEACGNAADRYRCFYSVTALGGTAHLTPLTSAVVLLAAGQLPEALMSGAATGLDAAAVTAAQTQLRNAIGASALADAGLPSDVDLITAALKPGSRTGLDRLLDGIGVSFGQDAKPFVQLSPRLGTGNVYLEPGTTQGSISIDTAAATLNLTGIETLFTALGAAMQSSTTCDVGMAPQMASAARFSYQELELRGAAPTALGLCSLLSGVLGDGLIGFGGKLLSPELGRCEFGGSTPVCMVSVIVQTNKSLLRPLALNQAVILQGDKWLFLGDGLPLGVSTQSRAQRLRRLDGTPLDHYTRAINVSIAAQAGLQCARVTQTDLAGLPRTLAYLKRHGTGKQLSVWTLSSTDAQPSLDPILGATRSADDRWIALSAGADGDAVVRNFYRSGRQIKVALFGDSACSAPFMPSSGGASSFNMELAGVPPLEAALPGLPWPVLNATTGTALTVLKAPAKSKFSYSVNWSFTREALGMEAAQLCLTASCELSGRISELDVAVGARTALLPSTVIDLALLASDFKQLRLISRAADGLLIHSDFRSCSGDIAGQPCSGSAAQR